MNRMRGRKFFLEIRVYMKRERVERSLTPDKAV